MRVGPWVVALMIAGAGTAAWQWVATPPAQSPTQGQGLRGGRRGAAAADIVPVSVATVEEQTVPVTRDGIGTVQAFNNVTVRSQVDGQFLSVEFTEGQMVRKGDVLARIDPTTYQAQYDQAVAKKAQDEATLDNARLDLVRYEKLAQTNAGPKQQADQQAAQVHQLEAQVKADEAAIANAKAILNYTTIVSPLDGRTGLRSVDPGNIIHANDSSGIVTITQITPIAVVFTLPQRDLAAVNKALAKGAVVVQVLDANGQGVVAQGKLETVDNQIDITTGTIRLKASFPNTDLQLWPGQFVSARVVVDTLQSAKVVPAASIRQGPNGTFAYVVDEDDKAIVRPVRVALQDANQAVVAEGLNTGERVVTIGFAQLSDGKPVQVTSGPGAAPANVPTGQPGAQPPGQRKRDGSWKGGHKREGGKSDGTASDGQRRRPASGSTEKPG